jgi:uncharacterized protein (TIGR03083 family)
MSTAINAAPLSIQPVVALSQATANAALEAAARQVVALLRQAPDGALPIPRSEWTVAEAAIHLVAGARVYLGCARGEGSPVADLDALPQLNARLFREFPTHDVKTLADLLEAAVAEFVAETAAARGDEPICWHMGYTLPLSAMTALLVGEMLLHGYDMARATRRPWVIEPAHARCALAGLAAVLPLAVDAEAACDVAVAYEIRVRGGPRFICRFAHGALRVEPATAGGADCRISVEPVPYLLVAYGRSGPWPAILRGQMRAGGRKPWLAFRFQRLLRRV